MMKLKKAKDLCVGDVILLPFDKTATVEKVGPISPRTRYVNFKTEYGSSRVGIEEEFQIEDEERGEEVMAITYEVVKGSGKDGPWWTVLLYEDEICKGADHHWVEERFAELAKEAYEIGWSEHGLFSKTMEYINSKGKG